MAKASKSKKKPTKSVNKRRERRFSTSPTFMPLWVAGLGLIGSLVLGSGVFGWWIADPAVPYASYLVAAGGFLLGVALWFGQPPESAVFVGDSGIAVEDGREITRVPWFDVRSIQVVGGKVVVEGPSTTVKFLLGANRNAAALALKEAAVRIPDVVDVDKQVTESLPNPDKVKGFQQDIEDDQVTGVTCAHSKKLITLEEDARICPRCGQIFHKDGLPEACTSCEATLGTRALYA